MTDCDIQSSSQTSLVALISSRGGSVRKGAAQGRVGLLYFHVSPVDAMSGQWMLQRIHT